MSIHAQALNAHLRAPAPTSIRGANRAVLQPMLVDMLLPGHALQIVDRVIQRVAVLVVDQFAFRQGAIDAFPDHDRPLSPYLGLGDLNPCADDALRAGAEPFGSHRQVVIGDYPWLEFCGFRKPLALGDLRLLVGAAARNAASRLQKISASDASDPAIAQAVPVRSAMRVDVRKRFDYQTAKSLATQISPLKRHLNLKLSISRRGWRRP